jgi:hypothetical protein
MDVIEYLFRQKSQGMKALADNLVVPPGGFEPSTPGLGNLCSIP